MPYLTRLPSGKWRATYRDRSGRRHSITRPTKTEAREEALEREREVRMGEWVDPAERRVLFSVWLERWKRGRVVVPNTGRKNASHLKNHVLPRWKSAELDGIERLDVQEWVADMVRRGVGAATIHAAVGVFGSVLQAAVEHGLLKTNPAHGLTLPELPVEPFRILSDAEVETVKSRLGEQDADMVHLTWRLGLRWGEVAGLHAHRVDLDRKLLHVQEVMTRHDGVKEYPKSGMSRRTLLLSDSLVGVLAGHLGTGLVFRSRRDGAPLDYTNWRRRVWRPAVQGDPAAGRPSLAVPLPSFHDLRHTCASNLIEAGVDVATVQQFMGHESLRTTQQYTHTTTAGQDRLRAVLNALDTPQTHATVTTVPRE